MKRKASKSPTLKKNPKRQHRNSFEALGLLNDLIAARIIPNQKHTFMDIMQRYYMENPGVMYRYNKKFEMPPLSVSLRRGQIYVTEQALKKKINGPGKTKNNPIVLYSSS
jgi:hypothetical protein